MYVKRVIMPEAKQGDQQKKCNNYDEFKNVDDWFTFTGHKVLKTYCNG